MQANKEAAEARADDIIKEAEVSQAHAYEVSGKKTIFTCNDVANGLAQLRAGFENSHSSCNYKARHAHKRLYMVLP